MAAPVRRLMSSQAIHKPLAALRRLSTSLYLNHFSHHPPKLNPDWALSKAECNGIRLLWPSNSEWRHASRWMSTLMDRLSNLVRVELVDDIPQPYKGTIVF